MRDYERPAMDITNAPTQAAIADSLLGDEAPQETQPEPSQYEPHGDDLLSEAVAEQKAERLQFDKGDAAVERLRAETPQEESQQPPERLRSTRQEQEQPEQQAAEQPAEPTPQQVAEVIQELDGKIQEYGLSDAGETSKFGSELASAFGADVQRDGWDVGLLNSTVARTALAAGRVITEVGGDLSKIAPVNPVMARELSRDVVMSFGINPRLNPPHDEGLLANTVFFGLANLLNTYGKTGETDPAKLNDAQMAVWFCESLQKGIFGVDKPVSRERAIQVVDCLARRVLGMDARVREWQGRQAASQPRGRAQRGQRVPAAYREGIRGSKAPKFSTNQDIFSGSAVEAAMSQKL